MFLKGAEVIILSGKNEAFVLFLPLFLNLLMVQVLMIYLFIFKFRYL